jgi:hypothetical protein
LYYYSISQFVLELFVEGVFEFDEFESGRFILTSGTLEGTSTLIFVESFSPFELFV